MSISVPVLAATLAFIAYTKTSDAFDVAIIFSSLALFRMLGQPLMFLPRALASIADAQSALKRLRIVFEADLLTGNTLTIDPQLDVAVDVVNAEFEWEEVVQQVSLGGSGKKGKGGKGNRDKDSKSKIKVEPEKKPDTLPFKVKDINIKIPRGQLTAVVGPVGSGKVCNNFIRKLYTTITNHYLSRASF